MRTRGLVLAVAVLTSLITGGVSSADLIHRYSFTEDASDSISGANGVLEGGALVSEGQLFLDGAGSYVSLPIGNSLSKLESCTIEGWVTWQFQNPWSRIFDFGNDTVENMFLTPRNGNNQRVRYAITIGGGGDEEQTTTGRRFPVDTETHFAVVIDAEAGFTALYLNGQVAAVTFFTTLTPSDLAPPRATNYLGRSHYNDPFFTGLMNEFRIYNTALTPEEIQASFEAGPDA